MALTVPLPAPRYWQTRHQHWRTPSGASALIVNRTAPQRHPPMIAIAVAPPTRAATIVARTGSCQWPGNCCMTIAGAENTRRATVMAGLRQSGTEERRYFDAVEARA